MVVPTLHTLYTLTSESAHVPSTGARAYECDKKVMTISSTPSPRRPQPASHRRRRALVRVWECVRRDEWEEKAEQRLAKCQNTQHVL